MKKVFAALLPFVLLLTGTIVFSSCRNGNGGNVDVTGSAAVTDEVDLAMYNFFESFYKLFNEKKFTEYVAYFDKDEASKKEMADSFNAASTLFDTTYKLESVEAAKLDNGSYSATVVAISTSINKLDNTKNVLREYNYYIISESNGIYSITSYSSGQIEIIE